MSRKNRAMFVGGIGAGKSTLTGALIDEHVTAVKTQALTYYDWIVDTPGEYTENPLFYKSIMATSLEITHAVFIQDSARGKSIFPPSFSTGINKLPIGVVTKIDSEEAEIGKAIDFLKKTIVKGPIVLTSAYDRKGLQHIRDLVELNSMEEMKAYVQESDSEYLIFHETLYK